MKRVGILGGGQLGRMIAIVAHRLNIEPVIFTNNDQDPALQVVSKGFVADYQDQAALLKFAKSTDAITIEFENIPIEALEFLCNHSFVAPNVNSVKIAQNRILEKEFLDKIGITTAKFTKIENYEDLNSLSFPCLLKTAVLGYDGKGQKLLKDKSDLFDAKNFPLPCVAEEIVDFEKEISVIVARSKDFIHCFPVAENVHENGILKTSEVPAKIDFAISKKAEEIAKKIADSLDLIGLLAVEFFLDKCGDLIVNEIATRPHNSGHWSMDCCDIDQFSMLLLCIFNQQIKKPNLINKCKMQNLIGKDIELYKNHLKNKNHIVHLYGKSEVRPGRKMGHVNILYD